MSGTAATKRSRVLRLRRWMLGGVLVFLALLVGLIGYARHRARNAILSLPHRLGIDIKSETDGFTYSQTVKGRTLFTIHAAKAIQHQDGKTILHNVAVTLYGAPGTNRTDTIRGNEFEYDQANGVVRALGETLLDVAAPETAHATAPTTMKRLTVRGNGFVFLQKLGIASTQEAIQFRYGASEGEATGADYDTDLGVLTLHHDVHLRSMENGHTESVDAASAQIDRNTRTATLQQAVLQDAKDTMRAPVVVANLRPATDNQAGSLEQVQASGGVTLATSTGQHAQASTMHADFTTENRFAQLTMAGDVRIEDEEMRANAQRATIHFLQGRAEHLLLAGQAHVERGATPAQKQILDASQIQAALLTTNESRLALGELHADGHAKLTMTEPLAHSNRVQRTELTATSMVATMAPGTRPQQMQHLDATGGTHLVQDDGTGAVRTSSGDRLQASFAPAGPQAGTNTLQSVLQQGHVVIVESRPAEAATPARSARAASQSRATADRADFQSSTDLLVLTGNPHVVTDGLQLAADRMVLHRTSGDADAAGVIRGSMAKPSAHGAGPQSAEPTQFAAATAHLSRDTGIVVLKGDAVDARLWTGSGQIEAPVIEADQRANTLHAFSGSESASGRLVKTVLVQSPGDAATQGRASTGRPISTGSYTAALTRVFSRDMLYHGANAGVSGTVTFQGAVRLFRGSDVISADTAIATLQPGKQLAGALQSIAADGHVRVVQGGRLTTGAHLNYNVADRQAILTGLPGMPPVARDPVQGTLTGKELVLSLGQSKEESRVEVTGAPESPVHLELDVPERSASTGAPVRSRVGRKPRPIP